MNKLSSSNFLIKRFVFCSFIGLFFLIPLYFTQSEESSEFAQVIPGKAFHFPKDHGAHPEFKTEWWYFTGHLQDEFNHLFGFQWTVFRVSLPRFQPSNLTSPSNNFVSRWRSKNLYFAHFAVSDLENKKFYYSDQSGRDGEINLAGSSAETFKVWLPGFQGELKENQLILQAKDSEKLIDLKMLLPESVLLQGEGGYSPKSKEKGKASYYYSIPNLSVKGILQIQKKQFQVSGKAWMDHEFGSNQLSESQSGWDWFGIPLQNRSALMIYRLRDKKDRSKVFILGTYLNEKGERYPLQSNQIQLTYSNFWKSKKTKGEYPLSWEIRIPDHQIFLKAKADFEDQELITEQTTQVIYWEGSISVEGRVGEEAVSSKGYLEMTGYAESFEKKI